MENVLNGNKIEEFKNLLDANSVEVYRGLEAYTKPLIRRIEVAQSPIKQIINGIQVAEFHKKTDSLVNEIISTRVEKVLHMQNLIRFEDKELEIELTNPKTLKEARLLPKGISYEGIFCVFGDYFTLTSLNKDPLGIIVRDRNIAKTMHTVFDTLWNIGEKTKIID